jgi:AcrR family transcriptional regulator
MTDTVLSMPTSAVARRKRRILGLDEEQRQAARRALLLDAALDLFGTRGYRKTTIELLCQTASVGTNSFYDIYQNKEAVLIDLYDDLSARFRGAVAEAYAEHRHDEAVIRHLISRFIHEAVDDPKVARVAFIESAGVSPAVEEHRRTTRNEFVDGLQAIGRDLRGGATDGPEASRGPARPSARRNAVAVVGAIIELTIDWLLDPAPDPVEQLIDDISHHCERVLRAILDEAEPSRTARDRRRR